MGDDLLNNKQVQMLLGALQMIVLGLLAWASLTIIELQSKVAVLENKQELVNSLDKEVKEMSIQVTRNQIYLEKIYKKLEKQ